MNGPEQRAHTKVTTAIAQDLQALAIEWGTNFQTFIDRLDLHQREIAANHRTGMAARLELDRLEEEIRKLKLKTCWRTCCRCACRCACRSGAGCGGSCGAMSSAFTD